MLSGCRTHATFWRDLLAILQFDDPV